MVKQTQVTRREKPTNFMYKQIETYNSNSIVVFSNL